MDYAAGHQFWREHVERRIRTKRLDALRLAERLKNPEQRDRNFDEWFWDRCQRLGIEAEFRGLYETWRRDHPVQLRLFD